MLPKIRQDRSALRWIRSELDQTLREARAALEDYAEGQLTSIEKCIAHLHDVQGALEMAQVYGACMLADEMEQLALALAHGQVKRAEPAAETLMLGMVQLPAYLEKVEAGGADIPLALLPLLNDLRAAREAPLVSETSLFAPKLNAVIAAETVRPGSGNRDLPNLLNEQRSHFHRGLLSWIRGVDTVDSLGQIRDVLDVLNSAAGTARLRRLLDAAEALASALQDDDGTPALAVKPLFGKLDRVFKQVIDQGEESAMLDFPVELLKNLLYYIARSNSDHPSVLAVKRSADLVNTFPEHPAELAATDSLGAPDRELFRAVGDALAQDLRDVKDQLDLFIRSDRSQLDRLTGLADPVQRIGDTLGMVGRGDLRSRLKHRCEELRQAAEKTETPPDDYLMSLAADLLSVESFLSGLASGNDPALQTDNGPADGTTSPMLSEGELQQHLQSAIDEALVELAKTKDAILAFIEKPDHPHLLDGVPEHLRGVTGVLQMLELPETGRLLNDLGSYLAGLAVAGAVPPDAEQRDAIADVVISAELYMQSAVEPGDDRAKLLDIAETALRRLGVRETAQLETDVGVAPAASPIDSRSSETSETQAEHAGELDVSGAAEAVLGTTEDNDLIDPEILEVFSEEAQEELDVIQSQYPLWRANQEDQEAMLTMRRSFHTLKGSGRIVGASNLGEFAWSVENLLNRVIDGTLVTVPESLFALMDDVLAVLPALVAESGQPNAPATDVDALAARAFALASGEPADVPEPSSASDSPLEHPAEAVGDAVGISHSVEESSSLAPEAPLENDQLESDSLSVVQDLAVTPGGDLLTAAAGSSGATPLPIDQSTLAAGVDSSSGLQAIGGSQSASAAPALDDDADESILTAAELQDSEFSEIEATTQTSPDSSLSTVFLSEVQGHLNVLGDFVTRCGAQPGRCTFEEGVRRAMHTLRGSARTAGIGPMAELARALEQLGDVMQGLDRSPDPVMLGLLERSHHTLLEMAASVEDPNRQVHGWETLRSEVEGLASAVARQTSGAEPVAVNESVNEVDQELVEVFQEEARELLEPLEAGLSDWQLRSAGPECIAKLQRTLHTMKGGARLAGVLPIGDLSHAIESVVEALAEKRLDDSDQLHALVRHAADALAQDIERLTHGVLPESNTMLIERLESAAQGRDWQEITPLGSAFVEPAAAAPATIPAPTADTESSVTHAEDVLDGSSQDPESSADSLLLADSQLMTDSELLADSSLQMDGVADNQRGSLAGAVSGDSNLLQFPAAAQAAEGSEFVTRAPLPEEQPVKVGSNERVRVASEVLDNLVNNAGEVSIYRARIEQQNTGIAFNLGELGQTTDRLRAQLRNLEIETEAQILSRHEREGDAQADFDPLELDRYSAMQQLSRALSETVEDLSNLGQSLSDLSRDTDTLLLQQARVTTDLQDSLLRTRMVKFSSRVPRLERVVRQTCHSVGKQANLEVIGGEEDMDRAILERMMGPLEHLLRNAISHGIEDADARVAKGKSTAGEISLRLAREGSDVVLTLSDDGAGLDRERIRTKATERGLIEADSLIEDDELFQLILQPGFSTAPELSQVSGRGVGMDVVLNEVKQLGGTLDIDSPKGSGTCFTIRLPFTLAITDALLITMGEDIHAVPHSSMDGVVRIPVEELRAIYAGEHGTYRYGDRDYTLRYLGSMLGNQPPHIPDGLRWLPLLLVRSGEHHVAIHVDGLLGNRQIVVKSIGAQLSTVRWFTGGTILADGQIALILDTNSLVRADGGQQPMAQMEQSEPSSKGVSVMVVDDSITVRKVTSRLLERHNMQVVTAKDGVDAVTVLQEHQPDVMLLDIEMPRMDGYELARHMRSTPELSDIPIIMITSRTGDKHRNRALELGVKRYLGKPYQEADLLENIYTVLADVAL